MTTLLPWVAALAGAALVLYRVGVSGKGLLDRLRENLLPAFLPLVLSAALWGVGLFYGDKFNGMSFLGFGALIGSLAAIFAVLMSTEDNSNWGTLASILFPTAALGATHWLKTADGVAMAQNGVAIGACATALMLSLGKGQASWMSACATAGLVLADRVGGYTEVHAAAMTGLLLGLAASLGVFVSVSLFSSGETPSQRAAKIALTSVVIVFGGFLAAQKLVGSPNVSLIALGAVVLALLTHWLIEADPRNSLRFGVASAIWVAAATLAFAEQKSFGMAVMAAAGLLVLVSMGSPRAMLAMGPAVGLVFYRAFRNQYPEASRALDLGQHYAIVGLLLGVLLALIAAQWFAENGGDAAGKGVWGGLVWLALMVMVPLAASVLLGPKGVAGYVVGLGLAAFIEGFRGEARLLPLISGTVLAFLFMAGYGWIGDVGMLSRTDKTAAMVRYGLDILGLAVVLVLLSSSKKRNES